MPVNHLCTNCLTLLIPLLRITFTHLSNIISAYFPCVISDIMVFSSMAYLRYVTILFNSTSLIVQHMSLLYIIPHVLGMLGVLHKRRVPSAAP